MQGERSTREQAKVATALKQKNKTIREPIHRTDGMVFGCCASALASFAPSTTIYDWNGGEAPSDFNT